MANTIKLDIPIIPGMRQDVNRFAGAPPGTLREALNVRFEKDGEARRRNGYASTVDIAVTDTPGVLAKCGEKVLWNNDGYVYIGPYATADEDPAGLYPTLRPLGSLGFLTADSTSTPNNGMPGVAITADGYSLVVFCNDYGVGDKHVHYQLRHPEGNLLDAGSFDAGTTAAIPYSKVAPRVIALADNSLILVYRDQSSGDLEIIRFVGSTQTTATLSAAGPFDIFPTTGDDWLLVNYTGGNVSVRYMSALAVSTTTSAAPTATPNAISVFATSNRIFVGYSASTASRMRIYTLSGSTVTFSSDNLLWSTDASLEIPPVAATYEGTSTIVRVIGAQFQIDTGPDDGQVVRTMSGVLNGTTFDQDYHCPFNCYPVSRPFGPLGQYVIIDRVASYVQGANSVRKLCRGVIRRFEADPGPGFIHIFELSLGEHTNNEVAAEWLVNVPTDLDGRYQFLNKFFIPRGASNDPVYELLAFGRDSAVPELARGTSQTYKGVTLGGSPTDFSDLRSVSNRRSNTIHAGIDWSFPTPPGPMYLVSSNTASGGLTSLGVYQYLFIFRYLDALGRVHVSRLSQKRDITLGASDDTVQIYVTKEDITRKNLSYDVTIEVYRTENNGSAFYLSQSVEGSASNSSLGGGILITDTRADSSLVQQELLYTHSRVESHFPPAARYAVHTKSRTWLGGLFRGNTIQASLQHVAGEPSTFNNEVPNFRVQIPKECTGLAAVSDVLVAFTNDSIHAIYGEGPNDRGEGGFSEPQTLSTAVGCINSRSILQAEDAVLFQSSRGIEILDRGLGAPQYIGFPVRDELESRPFIYSSWYDSDDRTAHFLVGASYANPPVSTQILVYDFVAKAWSVDTAIDGTVALGCYSADTGNVLWVVGNGSDGGDLYVESTTETNDGVTAFVSRLTFHDIYPFGRDGTGSVSLYDMMVEPATGDVIGQSIGLDKKTTRSISWSFVAPAGGEEYMEMPPVNSSKCTSVQLTMFSNPTSATGKTKFLGGALWATSVENGRRVYVSTERQ